MSGKDRDRKTAGRRSRRTHDESVERPDQEDADVIPDNGLATARRDRTVGGDGDAVAPEVEAGGGVAPSGAGQSAAGVSGDLAALEAELEAARADAARLKEDWLRALAEADNTRKRSAREIEEQSRRAREQVLAEFLAVVDDVERALVAIGAAPPAGPAGAAEPGAATSNAGGPASATSSDASAAPAGDDPTAGAAPVDPSYEGIVAGLTLIHSRFMDTLARFDVKPMASENTPFDPHLHEAVMRETRHGVEPDQVIQVIQKGYWIGERVLRPARVVVSG